MQTKENTIHVNSTESDKVEKIRLGPRAWKLQNLDPLATETIKADAKDRPSFPHWTDPTTGNSLNAARRRTITVVTTRSARGSSFVKRIGAFSVANETDIVKKRKFFQ